ncbi:MAG: hypothetical protein ACRDU7_03315 [Acidimicrobiia bacterium]
MSTVVLLIVLGRTKVAPYASIFALAIPTVLVLGIDSVAKVEDVGEIPSGFPLPAYPTSA